MLEALLKRVDGLERRLQEENSTAPATSENPPSPSKQNEKDPSFNNLKSPTETATSIQNSVPVAEQADHTPLSFPDRRNSILLAPAYNGFGDPTLGEFRNQQAHRESRPDNTFLSDAILDAYFSRVHGKPFYILEESATRQRHHLGQLPTHMMMAIYAITVRYSSSSVTEYSPKFLIYNNTAMRF